MHSQSPPIRTLPKEPLHIRRATLDDAPAMAAIVNDWIDATGWMQRLHTRDEVAALFSKAFPEREIWVADAPVSGFVSLTPDGAVVRALYTARPGHGLGKAMLDHAKQGKSRLQLWTHEANTRAQKFYRREGFSIIDRNPKGDDGIPELLMEWRR
ncbi:GNAT family N-acetyltransferase [Roseibium sp. RKSG952]|uniref:GNAT family N-acetyltransferase n=1 Tax=Roseibium sp. RKSG952 TaxID=2529384 RepID=UPI0012BC00CF|nr:GNAT family N-acetyltransferase [Roseibium sp. RKSG952]MTH98959.1 GNAT family N-acetyltransferase [Roseibium sp. RKSG952]